jgi:SAM-dependent methyltransferase
MMDDPDLAAERHEAALRGMERINRWSRAVGTLWPVLERLTREDAGGVLRVLDVASGAGDVPIGLWRRARREGLNLSLAGCDRSPRAVEHARISAERSGANVAFFQQDALSDDLPKGYDVVISSLFLHHLDQPDAVRLLERMSRAASRMVLVNDLLRSRAGYAFAWLGTRLLLTSDVNRTDGPLSVRAAFTIDEVQELAEKAGLKGAVIERRWPCRFLLTWSRP